MDQLGATSLHRVEPIPEIDATRSFEDFFQGERDRLFGLLVLVTGDRHEAEEIDAFVAVWERRSCPSATPATARSRWS